MVREIPLFSRKYPGLLAIVDDEDYEAISSLTWGVSRRKTNTYAVTTDLSPRRLMHQLILPGHPQIDHKDRNGLNNCRGNLRPTDDSGNQANVGPRCTNTSGYKGVCLDKRRGKWVARVVSRGKSYYAGSFNSAKDAAYGYDIKAREVFGEYAGLNFPGEVIFPTRTKGGRWGRPPKLSRPDRTAPTP